MVIKVVKIGDKNSFHFLLQKTSVTLELNTKKRNGVMNKCDGRKKSRKNGQNLLLMGVRKSLDLICLNKCTWSTISKVFSLLATPVSVKEKGGHRS